MDDQRMSFQPSLLERVAISTFNLVNKFVPWYKMPSLLGALNLALLRVELRGKNLFDSYPGGEYLGTQKSDPTEQRYLAARNSDGADNSLEMPKMGCAMSRFGRNFPRKYCQKPTEEDLWTPNPVLVSDRFMARTPEDFVPASTLNLLAAAWIQFQTHDWFNHEDSEENYNVPLPPNHLWSEDHMMLPKTKPDPDSLGPSDQKCPAYRNINTAWWDASQIYGSNEAKTQELRASCEDDGKLKLNKDGSGPFLPRDATGLPETGFNTNWWVGMELLHTLFAMEHNAICDAIKEANPTWTGDRIFDKARLVNCALMAKIHTVEWTPAILAHPALKLGMDANWWGLAGETLSKLVGRISKTSEIISGIPGSGVDNDGVPYSLTEEFVSVYRMHSLIPDNIAFFSVRSGEHQETVPIKEVAFEKAQMPFDKVNGLNLGFDDVFYSFGINYPGAITNNNYPEFLRDFTDPKGVRRDLGTVDILRDRERGVPRYCEFRRMLRMSVPKTFEELVGGVTGKGGAKRQKLALDLEEVYEGDISKVDALIGMHSEPLIPGFGFSETAFRIFIVMASRRLKSDRFIAGSWNRDMYTSAGYDWVQNSTMKDVLSRHFPHLKPTLDQSENVFAPWVKLDGSKPYKGRETNVDV